MTANLQKGRSSYKLTEIDASVGHSIRSYALTFNSSTDPRPQVASYQLADHHEHGEHAFKLIESSKTIASDTTSTTATQTLTNSGWSASIVLWAYYNSLVSYLSTLFLPTGYPHTVTPDYTPYQIYDSLQAFASSIAGLLSSRAVLQSLNVLDSTSSAAATATAATLLSVVQSTLSNLTTILFASHAAPRINTEVKYYRFLADIVNDAAFVLDLLAPSLPSSFAKITLVNGSFQWWTAAIIAVLVALSALLTSANTYQIPERLFRTVGLTLGMMLLPFAYFTSFNAIPIYLLIFNHFPSPRTVALCLSSVLRAICGVSGGSSKAVLSAHFARNNPENIGDLNAKDGSQETVIGLLGMWFGGVVVSRVEGQRATWIWMICLLNAHLWCNWKAVRSVRLRSLNRQRATLVCEALILRRDSWKTDVGVNGIGAKESILGLRETFRNEGKRKIGVEFSTLLATLVGVSEKKSTAHKQKLKHSSETILALLLTFENERYILAYDRRRKATAITLKTGSQPVDQLKAWLHSITVHTLSNALPTSSSIDLIERSLARVNETWDDVCTVLSRSGWDLDLTNLEEIKGVRLQIDNH